MALEHDQELGKRDDDHDWKPRHGRRSSSIAALIYLPTRWRRSRILVGVTLILVIYLFHLYLPGTSTSVDGASPSHQSSHSERVYQGYDAVKAKEPQGAPPIDADSLDNEGSKHYYNGATRFYKLASSLLSTSMRIGGGGMQHNPNILFAASSLKSLANLILMACEMSNKKKNSVHIVVFGRSTISVEEIMQINGIDEDNCLAHWHDARGDYAEYSSEARVEASVKGAMKHIHEHMHPQVIFTDDGANEEDFFVRAMRAKAKDFDTPIIEVPSGKYEDWLWTTWLRAQSLANWYTPNIDILIQAPLQSSGRLIRLLQSLTNADYRGLKVPRLTIELPAEIEPPLQRYLEEFRWPPVKGQQTHASLLSLRHRIASSRASSEQASLRFVESFYPNQPNDHHVLILSPQAEINPRYLQYLQYAILHYRYSAITWPEELMGISLDVPTSFVNGSAGFQQPKLADMSSDGTSVNEPAPFMYQAPSSTATLVFGERWVAFQDFLANRVQVFHNGNAKKTRKLVSEAQPSWVEHLLELMSARNWLVMQPATSLGTIHNELAQIPEEYLRPSKSRLATKLPKEPAASAEEPFILSDESPVLAERPEPDPNQNSMPLHKTLPFNGELQSVSLVPYVGVDGSLVSFSKLAELRDDYLKFFREAIGGCTGSDASRLRKFEYGSMKTDDLFCLPGQKLHSADGHEAEMNDGDYDEGEDGVPLTAGGDKKTRNRANNDDDEGFVVVQTPAKALPRRGMSEADDPGRVT